MKATHRLDVATEHGHGQRRTSLGVGRLEICAQLDQQVESAIVTTGAKQSTNESVSRCDDVVQRGLFLFVLRQPPGHRLRIIADDTPEQVEIAKRNRCEDVMPGAALDEQIDDGAMRLPEQRGPADDVHLVKVANAMYVGTRVEQQACGFDRTTAGGEMEWKRVVTHIARVRIRALFEQEPDCVRVLHSYMQRSGAIVAFMNETRLGGQQPAHGRDVAGSTRVEKRLNRGCGCHGCRL